MNNLREVLQMANLLTTTELAKHLKCSRPKVVMMAESGMIPSINVSIGCRPSYRFEFDEVMEALKTPPLERNRRARAGVRATFLVLPSGDESRMFLKIN